MLRNSGHDSTKTASQQQEKENNRLCGVLEDMKQPDNNWHEKYEQEMLSWKKDIGEKTKEIEQLKQLSPNKKPSFWSSFRSTDSSTPNLTALELSLENMQDRLIHFETTKEKLEEHFAMKETEWLQLLNSQEVLLEAYELKSKQQEEMLENYSIEQKTMQKVICDQEAEFQMQLADQENEFQCRFVNIEQEYQAKLAEQKTELESKFANVEQEYQAKLSEQVRINEGLVTEHTKEQQEMSAEKEQKLMAEVDELQNMIQEYGQKIEAHIEKEEMLTKKLKMLAERDKANKNNKHRKAENRESSLPETGFTFLRQYAPLNDNYKTQF